MKLGIFSSDQSDSTKIICAYKWNTFYVLKKTWTSFQFQCFLYRTFKIKTIYLLLNESAKLKESNYMKMIPIAMSDWIHTIYPNYVHWFNLLNSEQVFPSNNFSFSDKLNVVSLILIKFFLCLFRKIVKMMLKKKRNADDFNFSAVIERERERK